MRGDYSMGSMALHTPLNGYLQGRGMNEVSKIRCTLDRDIPA